ncbi:DivIVA domain-containing protein [Staphylospora marina]|uniref:DivIVA domain-containing protein n=1 Tax=Staphylospora marina TaxID=2490858 RepID=UPI000F5C1D78|nr:DivIVA domain-containing protein [Staphylospora marina]
MRRLTPMDIFNKDFKQSIRGYDKDEVNDFLDQVIRSYEDVLQENEQLKKQIKELENQPPRSPEGNTDKYDAVIRDILMRLDRLEQYFRR